MAEEIVKVLKIDTQDSQQTVKGLKKEISDLRDHILNLEKGTDDYNKAVDKLQSDQKRLDDAMSLTKKTATALEGSYDALVQQMALLKKSWRATNDEAKRGEIGKQIAEINTKLKGMDEEIGNFQRSVGDYKNSIVDAFDEMNHSVDEFKNKAADAWEKGDIEAYTKAIEDAGKAQAKVEKIEQDLEASTPTLEKGFQNLTDTAAGLASGFEVFQSIMVLTGNDSEEFEKVMIKVQATMALVQGLQGIGGLIKSLKGLKVAVKAVNASVKAAMASNPVGWILLIVGAVASLTMALAKGKKPIQDYTDTVSSLARAHKELGESFEISNRYLEREIKLMGARGATETEMLKKRKENLVAQKNQAYNERESIRDVFLELIDGQYHEDFKKANKFAFYGPLERYVPKRKGEGKEEYHNRMDAAKEVLDLFNEANKEAKELEQRILDIDTDIQAIAETAKTEGKAAVKDAYKYGLDLANQIAYDSENMDIPDDDEIESSSIAFSDKGLNLNAGLSAKKEYITTESRKKLLEERNELLKKGIDDEKSYREIEYQNTLEAEQKKYDAIREYWEKANGADKLELYQQMKEQELAIDEMVYERKKELRDEDLASEAEVLSAKQELFSSSMSLLSGVVKGMADLYQQDLDNQLAAGKISAEAYEEQFKKVKAMQIAEATINTIAGALGAFMGITKDTGGWGIAVAAIQAASVAATGAFEIAKIAKTEPGASNVERGMVQPPQNIFNESEPHQTHILTGNKEIEELNKTQKVVLVESEMVDSLKKVKIIDEETDF